MSILDEILLCFANKSEAIVGGVIGGVFVCSGVLLENFLSKKRDRWKRHQHYEDVVSIWALTARHSSSNGVESSKYEKFWFEVYTKPFEYQKFLKENNIIDISDFERFLVKHKFGTLRQKDGKIPL